MEASKILTAFCCLVLVHAANGAPAKKKTVPVIDINVAQPATYQPGYQAGNGPGYQTGYQPGYQSGLQPGYQGAVQPVYQNGVQPGYQAEVQPGSQSYPPYYPPGYLIMNENGYVPTYVQGNGRYPASAGYPSMNTGGVRYEEPKRKPRKHRKNNSSSSSSSEEDD